MLISNAPLAAAEQPYAEATVTIVGLVNNRPNLQVTGATNENYRLEASGDQRVWRTLVITNSPTGVFFYVDQNSVYFTRRFYRASWVPKNVASTGDPITLTLPVVSIEATDPEASETGPDTGTFMVSRIGDLTQPLTVNCGIAGTAQNGVDYRLLSGSVIMPAGRSVAMIIVTPIDDKEVEGTEPVTLSLSADAQYQVGTLASATVTLYDNDVAKRSPSSASSNQGIVVSTTSLTMLENGFGTFMVRLAAVPTSNVTVAVVRSSGSTDVSFYGPTNFVFTPSNWQTLQTITVYAARDADAANDQATVTLTSPGVTTKNVSVSVIDKAPQALVLSAASLSISERSTGNFTVNLVAQPVVDVTINVALSAGSSVVNVSSGATLTFTPSNYSTPQTVILTVGRDENTVNETSLVSISAAGMASQTVSVTSLDGDTQALVIANFKGSRAIAPASVGGNNLSLAINEGGTGTFTVALAYQPSSDVVITTARASGSANIAVSVGVSLNFTPANWNVPQTITVAASADNDMQDSLAVLTLSGTGVPAQNVNVSAADTDVQELVLSTAGLSFNEGNSTSFTVKLAFQPSSDVVVSADRDSGSANITVSSGASLTFTEANWNNLQTVTVTAATNGDTINSTATISVSASTLALKTVNVTATDLHPNQTPVVNTGADQTIALPASATLTGTVTDDGYPNSPGTMTTSWNKVSGPGTVTFGNANALNTTASFSVEGTYVLRLTANDGLASSSDDVQIVVNGTVYTNFVKGIDLNGPAVIIEGNQWLSHQQALADGMSLSPTPSTLWTANYAFALDPAPTSDELTMLQTILAEFQPPNGQGFTIRQTLPAGTYQVYVWTIENFRDNSADLEIRVQSLSMAKGIGDLPLGTWKKYGPYEATVGADQTLTIDALRVSKGNPMLTGFAIFGKDPVMPSNRAPAVNAGANQTITLPSTATLNGTVTDDGLPTSIALSIAWSKVSGLGNVAVSNGSSASTTASFSVAGTYVLRLTANDGSLSSSSDVTLTVNTAPISNNAPVVNAGVDQTVTLPNPAALNGAVSDDGQPVPASLSVSWSQVSGPATVLVGNLNAAATTASFPAAGTYVLRLTANDGSLSSSDDVTITVNVSISVNQAPVVSAGPDQFLVLPASANLTGAVSDDGLPNSPGSVTAIWSVTSGPGEVTFGNINSPVTTASFLAAGAYVLRLTATDGALISYKETTAVVYSAAASTTIQMPIYVTWPDRTVESATFAVSGFNPADTLKLWATVHGLNYDGKMGWQLNNGTVFAVKNSTVTVQGNGALWGGVGGDFSTITFEAPIPANTLQVGTNTIAFWYFNTNSLNAFFQHQPSSYQVLEFNIKDNNDAFLIPTNTFTPEDPAKWAPIFSDATSIALGAALWTNRNTLTKIDGTPMIASCSDCHMRDGRDLQYFGYHNKAIIARAKTHGLSQLNAERIASYIRSLPVAITGRPWNPPYQPGPGLDSRPLREWAAGAGINAVAANDLAIAPYIFPGGVITNTAIALHGRLSTREVPTEIQLPDWNHWLPQIHPLDAFGANLVGQTRLLSWYDGGIGYTSADAPYVLRRVLQKGNAQSVANAGSFWSVWDSQGSILRSKTGIPDYPASEYDSQKIYSIAQWQMVKTAELMVEYELEEIVPQQLLKPSPDPRMWRTALAFETSPNILHLAPTHSGIAQNTPRDHFYFTMAWYQTQLVLNGGSRCYLGSDYQNGQRPMDWGYMHNFLKSWPEITGRGNTYMFLEYFTKGLQSMDNGRGPELWGKAGWNPHAQYGIFWLFSVQKPCFNNVSTTTRRQVCEAMLRNWIAGNKLYPAADYYRIVETPWVPPLARPDWVPPQQSASGVDFLANGIWKCFGTGSDTMQGYGIDKALQNDILDWAKTVWPLANWDSLRPM